MFTHLSSRLIALLLVLVVGKASRAEPPSDAEPLPTPFAEAFTDAPTPDRPKPFVEGLELDTSLNEQLPPEAYYADMPSDAWCEECGQSHWLIEWLGGRHSSTHGRAIGPGQPLRGTSWLNRPYQVTAEFGALLMPSSVSPDVRSANDLFAAIQAGWDWDHYWGSQLRVGWSTPELINPSVTENRDSDNFFMTDASLLFYPWGDSRTRPYLRCGVGLTDLEFTDSSGRQHETMFTVPLAIGVKHQLRRAVVWRAEFAYNQAFKSNNADSTQFITLTLGVEGRFGGKSSGYWAWRPRGRNW